MKTKQRQKEAVCRLIETSSVEEDEGEGETETADREEGKADACKRIFGA